jgi:hypothetical protein
MTCLWPGLAPLWLKGSWRGLAVAIAFAGALNFALLTSFTNLLPLAGEGLLIRVLAWVLVLSFGVANFALMVRKSARQHTPAVAGQPQLEMLFCEAQTEYLKGHWIEAETLLASLLAKQPDDAEARLLLASVQRRTGRLSEAQATLTELNQLESSARWRMEIECELTRLAAREAPAQPAGDHAPPWPKAA